MFTRWISRNDRQAGSAFAARAAWFAVAFTLFVGWPGVAAAQAPPELAGFEFAQASLAGCKAATAEVRLSQPAPAGGVVVKLATDSPLVALPASTTIKAGSSSRQVKVATAPVTAETIVVADEMVR